jgi:7-cyano-7-deazaguanine reductase
VKKRKEFERSRQAEVTADLVPASEAPLVPPAKRKNEYTDEHAAAGVDAPLPEIETWPNQYGEYEIEIVMPEFTSICPKTGLPDHGTFRLVYVPGKRCLELKSLKMYMLAYRNLGIFQENAVNRFLEDVVKAATPVEATLVGDFEARGGISTSVTANYKHKKK